MATGVDRRPIPGFEGAYEVDALGRAFSLTRRVYAPRNGRQFLTTVAGRELRPYIDRYGYAVISLSRDGVPCRLGVHRAVCLAFHGLPPLPGMHAAHQDGVKLNNTPDNLRWQTVAENNEDRRRHGVHPMGSRLPHSKLTPAKAREIVSRAEAGESDNALAREYGVSNVAIRKVRLGRSWAHATGVTRCPEIEAEITRLTNGSEVSHG